MGALTTASLVLGDVGGSGAASHVASGGVLTLVIPLALLVIILLSWWLATRRGWPPLPTQRHPAPPRHRWPLRQRDE